MPSIETFKTNPQIITLVVALKALEDGGFKNCEPLRTTEAEALLNGTSTLIDVANARGIDPTILSVAYSECDPREYDVAKAALLFSDARVRALYTAIYNLRRSGIAKKKAKNLTIEEAEALYSCNLDWEKLAVSRGVDPWVLACAWSHEHFQLTGILSIPVDETKAAQAARKSKQTSGKLN